MKLKSVKTSAMAFALSASFILPHVPNPALAQSRPARLPVNMFPIDDEDDTGLGPTSPTIPGPFDPSNGNGNGNGNNNGGIGGRPGIGNNNGKQQPGRISMFPAKVPEEYSCSIFDNDTNSTIFGAIESLSKAVKDLPQGCSNPGTPSDSLTKSATTIKNSISALQKLMQPQDPSTEDANQAVSTDQIKQNVTSAITAAGEIGTIIENNEFLKSDCGRQTMSNGQVLLAFNEIINGLAPFALQAVSTSSVALPYLIGGSIASSAISTIAQMNDQKTLSMVIPEHRKAVLQNTCQFMKIAAKEHLMKMAQTGQFSDVISQLEKHKNYYIQRYSKPTNDLSSLLSLRESFKQAAKNVEAQLESDKSKLAEVNTQTTVNNDDLMICIMSNELVNSASDGKSFPASAMLNLEAAIKMNPSQNVQAKILKSFHTASMKRIADSAPKSSDDEKHLRTCAQAGRSWIKSLQQTVDLTATVVNKTKTEVNNKLASNKGYSYWVDQYNRAQKIHHFEKALEELAKGNSSIDRSELAQRMKTLKAALFGPRKKFSFGAWTPPVLAWIEHTKKEYDDSINKFSAEVKQIQDGSYSLTQAAHTNRLLISSELQMEGNKEAKYLANLNLNKIPAGSVGHNQTCKALESASSVWTSALNHLQAIQLFCNLISPVLVDTAVDEGIKKACGTPGFDGKVVSKSYMQQEHDRLNVEGIRKKAVLVERSQKALQCGENSSFN